MFNRMTRHHSLVTPLAAALLSLPFTLHATGNHHASHHGHTGHTQAPAGVMGSHLHNKGEWMFSYRHMQMSMEDNRDGTNNLSAETIATTVANRFFGTPGQPPTLRVVPTEMTMDMHMFGAMYGLSDDVTLMAMAMYQKREMKHTTFAGGAGTTIRGTFTTTSEGWGDTRVSALVRLMESGQHRWHYRVGLSLPTGSIKKTDRVLAPNGMTPTLRLPYPMQLGSGTYDLLAGLTYTGNADKLSWGAQYDGVIRLENENSENYQLGNEHHLTSWASYQLNPSLTGSVRLTYSDRGKIDGIDPDILAPVQTADPDNQGGEMLMLNVGLDLSGRSAALNGHELSLEVGKPIYQNLNGPQLKTDWIATLSYEYRF